MTRGVCWYLVGSFVLVSLAGCGRGFFSEEREPWRAEAEIACLKSGAVKEGPDLVRISPISGPGACGADFPLRVSAFGENSSTFGFADEDLRPPATIGNQPRWPVGQPPPSSYYSDQPYRAPNYGSPGYGSPSNGPLSLRAPGVAPDQDDGRVPGESGPHGWQAGPSSPYAPPPNTSRDRYAPAPERVEVPPYQSSPRLGPGPMQPLATGLVALKPAATLACPLVSVLDRWLNETVQPAAQRWFGQRVVEIKQISAYSCRGMNGNPNAHISEHAFGNALDIAAFTLSDGRRITVKDGWRGLPEEQGFLRDVEAGACQQFTTVLAPGSNSYHYDHIHVDLMRRASRRLICEPAAVSGEEVASRAMQRNPYASSREPYTTGALGAHKSASRKHGARINEEDEFEDE
ncbi:MAG TPA: extensin family protein [Bradyrhizobium sp.]|uniref:extensin-like domain-containing protein n=1 Tax=Bradyrhizobium sp. TaxID=376 RepID=UPI002D8025F0|nr:extensin family protein [Bradyrhizobium sp.]HET7889672.1 extensin family protein [Bradyrhizobium sp.]